MSTAPVAFHELLTKMDALAGDLGLTVRPSRTGRNYQPSAHEPGARHTSGIGVYATGRGVEFNLQVFRELGADDAADELLQRLRDFTGLSIAAPQWPAVPCEMLTRDWDQTRSEIIEPYFQARNQLTRTPSA